jgi:hypothetical protein
MAGSHNDIHVLQCSNVFSRLVEGHDPTVNFVINSHEYNKGYYLTDGIYPRWATFVKTISGVVPGGKKSWSAQCQEAYRKDVESAFAALQARFAIVRRYPALTWLKDQMWEVMNACVTMHNMIIESEREHVVDPEPYHRQDPLAIVDHQQVSAASAAFLATLQEI